MPIPTLLLTRPTNYSFANPSYDTWYWSAEFRSIVISRWFGDLSAQPVRIVPSNFNFGRQNEFAGPKLLVVGRNGCISGLVDDPSNVIEVENNSHASITIRTNRTSIGGFSVTDERRDWNGQLQYHNSTNQWVFCSNRQPWAYLSSTGIFSINKDLSSGFTGSNTKFHVTGISVTGNKWGTAIAIIEDSDAAYLKLISDVSGYSGIYFSTTSGYYRYFFKLDNPRRELLIGNYLNQYSFGFDKLGSVIISSTIYPNALMPFAGSLFYLYGLNASAAAGPHWKAHTTADRYPLLQNLNWSHDNIALSFDCFYESADWKSSSSTGNFQIYKIGSQLRFEVADIAAGLQIPTFYTAICISKDGRVSMGTQVPAASTILDLESTTGALLLPRMTTAERNLLTASNGMILYNTTLGKIQVYESGAWASVI